MINLVLRSETNLMMEKKNRGTDGRQKDISLRSKLYKVARFDLFCGT